MPELKELVINTTPILALIAAAGSLDMLPLLYRRVWVSGEVCREIRVGGLAAQEKPARHPFSAIAELVRSRQSRRDSVGFAAWHPFGGCR
jgi:hypothetical protein